MAKLQLSLKPLPKTRRFLNGSLASIFLLSLISATYLAAKSDENDALYFLLYNNLFALYLQCFVLVIIFEQILKLVRPVVPFLTVRQAFKALTKKVLQLVLLDSLAMLMGILLPTLLFSHIYFKWGRADLGLLLIFLRILCFVLCSLLLLGSLTASRPYFCLIAAIALVLVYHYSLEVSVLLTKYSIVFDPIYRSKHHIYF